MSAIQILKQPAYEPLTLAAVKLQLGYGPYEDSDHVLSSNIATRLRDLIYAAREYCSMFTRRAFVYTSYVQYLDSFPYYTDTVMSQQAYPPAYYSLPRYSTTLWNYSQMIKLYYSPCVSVDHITYIDSQTQQPTALTLGYPFRFPLSPYTVGENITDANGNIQACTTAGITGSGLPVWPTAADATTTDGTVVWTGTGTAAPESDYIVDVASEPARLFPVAGSYWPPVLYVPNAVAIYFTAGYCPGPTTAAPFPAGTPGTPVPAQGRVAMRMLIRKWEKDPDSIGKGSPEIERLLWSIRVLDAAATRG